MNHNFVSTGRKKDSIEDHDNRDCATEYACKVCKVKFWDDYHKGCGRDNVKKIKCK